jgi:hypothetical protein
MARTLLAVAVVLFAAAPRSAEAHDVRGTAIFLDVGQEVVELEIQIPWTQLALALRPSCEPGRSPCPALETGALEGYVRQHLSAKSRSGRAFGATVRAARRVHTDDGDAQVVHASLRAPDGEDARFIELRYDAVLQRVVTHNVYVFVRRDLRNAIFDGKPELAGLIHYQQTTLIIDRTGGSWWRGFRSVFQLGMRHIAEGTDHLLFLLMLLLPASLVVRKGRWSPTGSPRRSLRETVKIVSAFTVGHSLTLVAGAWGEIQLPARPIEVLIAISILVSAIHAVRPLFARREALVAGGFGLVHGLAFASVLAGFGFDGRTLAVGILGFNLGVEAMQLVVVSLTLPSLMVLSRSPHYRLVRRLGGALGLTAAAGWVVERSVGVVTPVSKAVAAVASRGSWVVVGLAALALVSLAVRSRQARAAQHRIAQAG